MTGPATTVEVTLRVNGEERSAIVEPRRTLVELLREDLELTGTHIGCEQGACGSCTVLIDGASARACLTPAFRAHGCEVVTIEGLADAPGTMSVLQQACMERHAFQCGFCTPGMLIVAAELLAERDDPSEAEVREALSGNLCRCTGYDSIVAAVLHAAERLRPTVDGAAS
ncbi:MAG: (2Fe-2S)-binding protein [Acidimicrobiales bacterium]|jgi:carbon-monoxide dehydrogenase small subunit|nr:(2Fe-2S)-binding protein [Acidimicrobiales bacterium]